MASIEPNLAALGWFAAFAAVASLGFYVTAGAFPLSMRGDLTARSAGAPLAIVNVFGIAALAVGAVLYGAEQLRWTSVVIVAGLAFLFAPVAFHAWPERFRDGVAGLGVMLALTAAAIGALQVVGGVYAS